MAGRMYHEADEVWEKLKVGHKLSLVRDLDNRYDPEAVAVMYRDEQLDEVVCLGYIPRTHNSTIATFLEMGWSDLFECRISKIDPVAHPEHQIHLTIKVTRRPA